MLHQGDEGDRPRLLFLCAARSVRSLMAASILTAQGNARWEIWSTPTQSTEQHTLARRVLAERGIPLLESPLTVEPSPGEHWDEGVILCSGNASF